MKILNPIAKIKDKENTLGLNIEKKPLTKKKIQTKKPKYNKQYNDVPF